jgi:hypothetical protein
MKTLAATKAGRAFHLVAWAHDDLISVSCPKEWWFNKQTKKVNSLALCNIMFRPRVSGAGYSLD